MLTLTDSEIALAVRALRTASQSCGSAHIYGRMQKLAGQLEAELGARTVQSHYLALEHPDAPLIEKKEDKP